MKSSTLSHIKGLRPEMKQQVQETGVLDFTKLRLEDVIDEYPGTSSDFDWPNIIFVKNMSTTRQQRQAIVWVNDHIFRTDMSPTKVINKGRAAAGHMKLDMAIAAKKYHLTQPYPVVVGRFLMVPTDKPQKGGHHSWINGHFVDEINSFGVKGKVRIQLENGMEMIVCDTKDRLWTHINEARDLFKAQSRRQDFADNQHHNDKQFDYVMTSEEVIADRLEEHVGLAKGLLSKVGLVFPDEEVEELVRQVLDGDTRKYRYGDERDVAE
ncbi:hypothetical protein [Levilactobacillus paucivorans]|uniref:hypothetical protein n=1 Tax=Levilactobacillus paucivorans TaxID=616990 RepID=UPI00070A558F|nr:hypothetical protein [Levilactobacillus paucivorans]